MAYEKNTWASGDVVTSAKLNHMEDGIAGGGSGGTPIINTTRTVGTNNSTVFTFDKTFAEVKAMLDAGQIPVVKCVYESNGTYFNPVIGYLIDTEYGDYIVRIMGRNEGEYYVVSVPATAEDAQPVYTDTPLT